MNYSKYGDISSLLVELCSSFSDDELRELTDIGARMSNDSAFDRAYTLEIKSVYLANIKAINNGTYIPKSFTTLNSEICKKIENNEKNSAVLLPEYAKFDHMDNRKDKSNLEKAKELKARILNLRKIR